MAVGTNSFRFFLRTERPLVVVIRQSCCEGKENSQVTFQFSFFIPSEANDPLAKCEYTVETSAGINAHFDGAPTGFPLYICAKCEHIVQ